MTSFSPLFKLNPLYDIIQMLLNELTMAHQRTTKVRFDRKAKAKKWKVSDQKIIYHSSQSQKIQPIELSATMAMIDSSTSE